MPAFTNSFSQPPPVTGLVLTVDGSTSLVTLEWTASTLGPGLFDHYRIERQVDPDPWELAGEQADRDDPTFVDEGAPAGVQVRYRVRVSIGSSDFLSEPLEGAIETPNGYAVVVPGDSSLTRGNLPIRFGVGETRPWDSSLPRPLGRALPLLAEDPLPSGRIGAVLSLVMVIEPGSGLYELIWAWSRRRPWLILKGKRGRLWRMIFRGITVHEVGDGEVEEASWTAVEVA